MGAGGGTGRGWLALGDMAQKNNKVKDPRFGDLLDWGQAQMSLDGKGGAFYRNIAEKHRSLIPIQHKVRYSF